ncbi:glutathione S-transferase T1-like [Salvia hispanica]|uniref:glutathione S-transferase T1-like n=1 Tax=Salvia hispanica TaxID=49212 RepID=UPI0020090381|nr:glutathione S-transferase T1-like [Salvia hispanica]
MSGEGKLLCFVSLARMEGRRASTKRQCEREETYDANALPPTITRRYGAERSTTDGHIGTRVASRFVHDVDFITWPTPHPEFAEVNPMKQVSAVIHGDFKLFESHAILIYLASTIPGVADHWYPADVRERAKVHSVLDWHHTIALAQVIFGYLLNTVFASVWHAWRPKAAAEGEKLLSASLARIESFWLQGGPFLLGNSKPTIADLALACEVTQLEVADQNDHDRIMEPHSKIVKWLKDVKSATTPHFEEIHAAIRAAREPLKKLKAQAAQKSE